MKSHLLQKGIRCLLPLAVGSSISFFVLPSAWGNDPSHSAIEDAARLARQKPREGLAALQALLKDDPDNVLLLADTILAANWAGEDQLVLKLYHQNPRLEEYADVVEATARSARNVRELQLAILLFRQARKLAADRWQPSLGLALSLAENGERTESEIILEALLLDQNQNTEAMAGCAYGFFLLEKPIRSLAAYQLWAEQDPGNEEALNGVSLSLSRARGNYRAGQLKATDILIRIEIAAGMAGQRVRWGRSYAPTRIIQKEETRLALAEIDRAADLANQTLIGLSPIDRKRVEEIKIRLAYDRITALRDLRQMEAAVDGYEKLPSFGPTPVYVREAAADAYLALRLPVQSEALYLGIVRERPDLATPWIGLAYSQLEMENPAGAIATMDEALLRSPIWLEAPGLRTPQANPDHEMIETQAGLMLSFTEDLPAAQKWLEKLRDEAPANTSIRAALARTYLARGWLIRGEEEMRIAQTINPDYDGTRLALAEILESQARRDASDQEVDALLLTAPDQERLVEFIRERDTDRGWKVTLESVQGIGNGAQVGTTDHHVETRLESHLIDNRWRFFINHLYDAANYADGAVDRVRIGGGLSYDESGNKARLGLFHDIGNPGESLIVEGGAGLTLGDHWFWEIEGSSDSLKVPLQGARRGSRLRRWNRFDVAGE